MPEIAKLRMETGTTDNVRNPSIHGLSHVDSLGLESMFADRGIDRKRVEAMTLKQFRKFLARCPERRKVWFPRGKDMVLARVDEMIREADA